MHIEKQINYAGIDISRIYGPPCGQVDCGLIEFITLVVIHLHWSLIDPQIDDLMKLTSDVFHLHCCVHAVITVKTFGKP